IRGRHFLRPSAPDLKGPQGIGRKLSPREAPAATSGCGGSEPGAFTPIETGLKPNRHLVPLFPSGRVPVGNDAHLFAPPESRSGALPEEKHGTSNDARKTQ